VKHSEHHEGLFIGRIGDEVVAYRLKTQGGARSSPSVDGLGLEKGRLTDGVEDVFADTSGRKRIVFSDEFPDVGDIDRSARV
jgi:hypothetical protein